MKTIIAAALVATAFCYPALAGDECVCVRANGATTCSNACIKSAPSAAIDLLRRTYPDLMVEQGINLQTDTKPTVDFWTPTAHIACRIKLGTPMVIDRCRQVHG
jgi:hypothetical protein